MNWGLTPNSVQWTDGFDRTHRLNPPDNGEDESFSPRVGRREGGNDGDRAVEGNFLSLKKREMPAKGRGIIPFRPISLSFIQEGRGKGNSPFSSLSPNNRWTCVHQYVNWSLQLTEKPKFDVDQTLLHVCAHVPSHMHPTCGGICLIKFCHKWILK